MENVFIKWPQRSWVLLGSCLSFRCRTQNVLRRLGRLLLCTNPIILSFLPSTQPRNVGFCAAHGTAHWLLPPAMSWSVLPLPALRAWQIPAALTRPVLGACLEHQSEASGCQTLKQMEQKPFWFILITWTIHSMPCIWEHLRRCPGPRGLLQCLDWQKLLCKMKLEVL